MAEQALRVVFSNIEREELVSLKDPVKHVFDKFTVTDGLSGFDEAMKAFLRKCAEDFFTIAIIGRRTDLSQITHPALDRYLRRSEIDDALKRIHSRVQYLLADYFHDDEEPLGSVCIQVYSDFIPDEIDATGRNADDSYGTCITIRTFGSVELYFFDGELEVEVPLDAALIKFPEVEAKILQIDSAPDALLDVDTSIGFDNDMCSVLVMLKSAAAETV